MSATTTSQFEMRTSSRFSLSVRGGIRACVSQGDVQPLAEMAADPCDVVELREQGEALRTALVALTPDERQAIETTFFGGLTHAEARRG
jgi:DNA-directed RNA polymerase specialized sigma24 family protein